MAGHPLRAVTYARVSTDEQADRGFSLRDQQERLSAYCRQRGIEAVQHYVEDHSAKTFERPAWKQLMRYVRANRAGVDQLLFVKWDRFSRNATDAFAMLRELEGLGVEAQAIEQPIDRAVPEQLMMLAIYVSAPEVENRRRSINTIMGMRRAAREGRWVTSTPKGYVRRRDERDKSILVPDEGTGAEPGQAPHVRRAFELAAHTDRSLESIRRQLAGEGFKCSRSHFLILLRQAVYMGKVPLRAWRDEPAQLAQGLHEGLVSEALFQRVQQRRFEQEPPRPRRALRPELPLRGHLLCPACLNRGERKLLTGSGSTGNGGRYWYYHCESRTGKQHPGCRARFRAEGPEGPNEAITTFLTSLEMADEVAVLYSHIVEDVLREGRDGRRQLAKAERRREDLLLAKLTRADEAFVEGELPRDAYHRLHEKYAAELRASRARLAAIEENQETLSDHLGFAVTLFRQLGRVYAQADLAGKDALLGSIFPGRLVFERGSYRTGSKEPLIALLAGQTAKTQDAALSGKGGVLSGSPGRT